MTHPSYPMGEHELSGSAGPQSAPPNQVATVARMELPAQCSDVVMKAEIQRITSDSDLCPVMPDAVEKALESRPQGVSRVPHIVTLWLRMDELLGLDVGRPDHPCPFLGFIGDELSELGGRKGKSRISQVTKARL
jgi:hypothetical protein